MASMKYDRVPMESKPIAVKLDKALLARIDAVSKKMGEPRSTVMRVAMRIGLDSLEKAFEAKLPNLSSLVYDTKGGAVEGRPGKKPSSSKDTERKIVEALERDVAKASGAPPKGSK